MKRYLLFACAMSAVSCVLFSCESKEEVIPAAATLEVSSEEVSLEYDGGDKTISITSNSSWTITGAKTWLKVNPLSGQGDMPVVISANSENTSLTPRECELTIATYDGTVTKQVKVIQGATQAALSVDIDNLTLSSSSGSVRTFNILSNDSWTITGCPDWLELSAVAGSGNVEVTVGALTTNYSAADRTAELLIESSTLSTTISIIQKAAWLNNCVAKPINVTVLYDCAGFEWELSENVAYYYYGSLEKTEAERMTTLEIIEYLIEDNERCTPGDNYISSVNYLYQETDYILYTVAFNKDGVQGDLYAEEFRTKSSYNQPYALIEDVQYTDSMWYWSTVIGPYATAYYMWASQSINYYYISDGLVAYLVKYNLDAYPEDFPKIVQNGEWNMSRSGDLIHIVTWGVNVDGELGGYIERFRADLFEYSVREDRIKTSLSYEQFVELSESLFRLY